MAKAIETVLRVEGEVSARLEQVLRVAKPLAALIDALGERINPKKPPAWLSEFPFNETTKADLSWDATPWIDQNGTIYVQGNGLHAVG